MKLVFVHPGLSLLPACPLLLPRPGRLLWDRLVAGGDWGCSHGDREASEQVGLQEATVQDQVTLGRLRFPT
ncbi:hypothetical protein CapIbe_006454 [Capra ibex]